MPKGFFAESSLRTVTPLTSTVPKCGACQLYKSCKSPKMPLAGKGGRNVLILAEAPGEEEDERGVQLVGNSGKHLMATLKRLGVDMRSDCWLHNALICRPPKGEAPTAEQIEYCRPNLVKVLEEKQPEVIVPIGQAAVHSLIPLAWKGDDLGGISKWVGWDIPSQKLNAWIVPTWHPAYLLRMKDPVLDRSFENSLRMAFEHDGRPWDVVPDYKRDVRIVLDHREAARLLRKMIERGGNAAFDYEATMLKPEFPGAEIICCSVCWNGKVTIAYPWHGEAIAATKELIQSPRLGKIASNLKFEDRWTGRLLGIEVVNWVWDTMNSAHVADCRPGISGLKFQGFVQVGAESYDENIKPYLKANKKGGRVNRAHTEVELQSLLLYCGIDSLLEYKVAKKQLKAAGFESFAEVVER